MPPPERPVRAGKVLARVVSPAATLPPPLLHNADLIPPRKLAGMQRIWDKRGQPASDVVISVVERPILAEAGLAFTDALEVIQGSFAHHTAEELARSREAITVARAAGTLAERAGTYVLCKKNGARNYGHWLMEMFPKASLGCDVLAASDLNFVVPDAEGALGAVIGACMASLGIAPSRLLRADDAPLRVERLVIVDGLSLHASFMSPLVIAAVRRLAEGVAPGPHRRLYVTRDSVGHRCFVGAAGVAARAATSGHVAFDPGMADLATQIATFAGATRIVGLMGAAMTNIVFAPPDAEIVMLAPAGMPDTFYWYIAALRGLRYVEVRCPAEGPAEPVRGWSRQMMAFPEAQAPLVFPPPRHAGTDYGRVWLAELAAAGLAEASPAVPAASVDIPALAFGTTDFSAPGIAELMPFGPGELQSRHGPVRAFVLRDAVVHGPSGVVTCGASVVGDTTRYLDLEYLPGAVWRDPKRLHLPDTKVAASLDHACHLLAGNPGNYFHWLLDGLARFDAREPRGVGLLGQPAPLLVARPGQAWQRQSLDLLVPPDIATVAVEPATRVHVARLLIVPLFAGGAWWQPHPATLAMFDRIRAAAYALHAAPPPAPWLKLFVSRADSAKRVLANEAEICELAAAAGFARVVLDGLDVARQVRLFAEATHVIAPHGAGLTNLAFCRPGAAVCELQRDSYVHWGFRGLAALRRLRYGCVVGSGDPRPDSAAWRIDPAAVARVLADPGFIR